MPKKTTKKKTPSKGKIEIRYDKGLEKCCDSKGKKYGSGCGGCAGAGYGLGFIGALVYYVSTTSGFWMTILGILKALVWPAFLVFELMKNLGM